MIKYYNNGLECHKYEEGSEPEGYVPGVLKYRDLNTIDFYNDFVPYYIYHSRKETANYFNITENMIKEFCHQNNWIKPWKNIRYTEYGTEYNNIDDINLEEYLNYYKDHTRDESLAKFNITKNTHEKIIKMFPKTVSGKTKAMESGAKRLKAKYQKKIELILDQVGGLENYLDYYRLHTRDDCLEKFSLTRHEHELIINLSNYSKDKADIKRAAARKYFFDNHWFDSLPEIIIYKYFLDQGAQVEIEPITLQYIYNNRKYSYIPDLRVDGQLFEIKGKHFFKEDGTMCNPYDHSQDGLYEAKHQCGINNKVKFITENDLIFKEAKKYLKDIKFNFNQIKRIKE